MNIKKNLVKCALIVFLLIITYKCQQLDDKKVLLLVFSHSTGGEHLI